MLSGLRAARGCSRIRNDWRSYPPMVIFQTIFPPGDADMPGFGGFDQFDLGLKEGVPA